MTQSEYYGRRCWTFCAKRPRTFVDIAHHLQVADSMTQLAINWCKREYDTTKNPFLMVRVGSRYLYAPRSTFAEVRLNMGRELRYLRTRIQTNINTVEHALATNGTITVDATPKDRRKMRQWVAQMSGAAAAIEMVLDRVE